MAKTVVGLYEDLVEARHVVDDLVNNGISRDDISLMVSDPDNRYTSYLDTVDTETDEVASGAAAGAVGGAVIGGLSGVLLGLGAIVIPGIGPVIAAGPIVAGLAGAGLGAAAGGLVGALVGWGIPEEEAVYYSEGIRRGGTLVAVKTLENQVDRVTAIMNRHDPINIRERAETWRQAGWTGYNEERVSDDYDHDYYQHHYQANYANTGRPYTYYEPAYHYGHTLATDENYRGRDWYDLEPEFHRRWESEYGHQGAWDEIKSAVRHAWNRLTDWGDYDDESYEQDYRTHYNTSYASTGRPYTYYEPAYRYGYMMALDERYRGRNWNEVESDIRRHWESEYGARGAWEDFKGAIRHAWDHVTAKAHTHSRY